MKRAIIYASIMFLIGVGLTIYQFFIPDIGSAVLAIALTIIMPVWTYGSTIADIKEKPLTPCKHRWTFIPQYNGYKPYYVCEDCGQTCVSLRGGNNDSVS